MNMNHLLNIAKTTFVGAMAVAGVCLTNGCSDFLDKEPLGKLSESVLLNEDGVDKMLIACYSALNGYLNGLWGITSGPDNVFYGDMCAGNMHKGSTTGDQGELLQMERYAATSENSRIREKWICMYGGIERCNDVLRMLNEGGIEDLSAEKEIEYRAEARFLRGYYHFELKKLWNMVPYIDENVEDPQRRVPNDRDIWPDIEADFTFAMENLPENQEQPGRPTKSAAQAFLAKTYLFQQKYSEAKTLLDEVIGSGKYHLITNYFDNFNAEQNNNAEVVWSNQVAVNVAGAGYNRSQRGFDLSYPNAPDQPNLSGAGFQQPSFDLVNAYQVDEDGLPMIDTYYLHEFKNDMNVESSDAWEPDMETPVDPRLDWVVGRRGVPYHDWGLHPGKAWIRDQVSAGPYNQKKWVILQSQLSTYAHENTAKFNAMNFPIIRYAQVLLWAAECEVEVGDPEKARAYVNMVRQRAKDGSYVRLGDEAPFGDGPYAANYQVDIYKESWAGHDKEWMRDRVRFEERLELALEGHFFFDLVRWGIAEEFINAYLAREKGHIQYLEGAQFDANDCYFAIPLTEIDRSYVDGKPTLTQNPGY